MKNMNLNKKSIFVLLCLLLPIATFAGVESTMQMIESKLTNTFLPFAAFVGLVFAAISFYAGNDNARRHVFLAVVGSIIGFGAKHIVTFLRALSV